VARWGVTELYWAGHRKKLEVLGSQQRVAGLMVFVGVAGQQAEMRWVGKLQGSRRQDSQKKTERAANPAMGSG
jgi:hypothetical protein